MNGSVGFVALLQISQSKIVLRISVVRSNSDRLLTTNDRFLDASLSQQEISQVSVCQIIV